MGARESEFVRLAQVGEDGSTIHSWEAGMKPRSGYKRTLYAAERNDIDFAPAREVLIS
jgi:hypothetical protein